MGKLKSVLDILEFKHSTYRVESSNLKGLSHEMDGILLHTYFERSPFNLLSPGKKLKIH
jgi:hypothetical protein